VNVSVLIYVQEYEDFTHEKIDKKEKLMKTFIKELKKSDLLPKESILIPILISVFIKSMSYV
jgi:hypothetical protein